MTTATLAAPSPLPELLRQRLLILDGAMGTMIQRHPLTEEDFRGARFADHPKPLRVEYALTPAGHSLGPMLRVMHDWGTGHMLAQPGSAPEDWPAPCFVAELAST